MKKSAFLLGMAIIFLFAGCGQDLNVTVYNSTGVTSTTGWVAINVHSENTDIWFEPTGSADSIDGLSSANSYTFKAKENDTINISGNGRTYNDPGDTSSYTTFTLPTGSQTLYGGFLETPDWYAAVNMESVIIYKK